MAKTNGKNPRSVGKLHLRRDTLGRLSEAVLREVVGGKNNKPTSRAGCSQDIWCFFSYPPPCLSDPCTIF